MAASNHLFPFLDLFDILRPAQKRQQQCLEQCGSIEASERATEKTGGALRTLPLELRSSHCLFPNILEPGSCKLKTNAELIH